MRSYYNGNGDDVMEFFIPIKFGYDSIVRFEDEGTVEYTVRYIVGIEPDGQHVLYIKRERLPRHTLPKIGEWEKYHVVFI